MIRFWRPIPWPEQALKIPPKQCHRGYHRGFHADGEQENTLEAFRLAKKFGVQMIELDVRASKEGQVVVFHDEDLKRFGFDDKVSDLSAKQLKERVRVPTLGQVLMDEGVPNLLNIEIKSESGSDDGFERKVVEVVKHFQAQQRVLFSSFNPLCLRRLAKLLPNTLRALLVSGKKEAKNKFYLRRMWLAPLSRAHLLHLEQDLVTPKMATLIGRRKIPFAVWTVNDPARVDHFLQLGAVSVISDLA